MDHSTMDHSTMNHGAMHGMVEVANAAGGFDYTLAFTAGFLGSGHCLGMCGALVSGYFMNAGVNRSYWPYLMYQLSRISVYTCVGFTAAALGVVLVSSGLMGKFQSFLQMFIGVVVIVLALGIIGILPLQGSIRLLPINWLRKGYASARTTKAPLVGAMLAGFLNGLMPCPLTFAMAVKATTASSITEGGLIMLTFGAGTLPMMLFVSVAFGKMNVHFRGLMLKSAAVIMIYMGVNTFYRGLSFYTDANFKQHNFWHMLKTQLDSWIALLNSLTVYFTSLIATIQSM